MHTQQPRPVYIYWDNSNIFISAKNAAETQEGFEARGRVRIHFEHLFQLAAMERTVARAIAVGSVPPELHQVWERLRGIGVEAPTLERGGMTGSEQGVDQALQVHMLRALADSNGNPGIAVLLTGDGKGLHSGVGFHADLYRMHQKGWGIEVLAWEQSCNLRMRQWVESVGVFVPLEDFYHDVTFIEPSLVEDIRGTFHKPGRKATAVDQRMLARRQTA